MGSIGNVRVLDPHDPVTAMLPGSVPVEAGGVYCYDSMCKAELHRPDINDEQAVLVGAAYGSPMRYGEGLMCTRPAGHSPDEIHVCHLLDGEDRGTVILTVVWGGE